MGIKSTRIDDRLIHGQVASSWLRYINADQVIVVNDEAASDPVQTQMLKMAAPDLKVHVFGTDKFVEIFNNQPIKRTTFVILSSVSDLLTLIDGGVETGSINYGGQRKREDRTMIYAHDLQFSPKEEEDLKKLLEQGVEINYQVAAYDSPVPISEKIKKSSLGS